MVEGGICKGVDWLYIEPMAMTLLQAPFDQCTFEFFQRSSVWPEMIQEGTREKKSSTCDSCKQLG